MVPMLRFYDDKSSKLESDSIQRINPHKNV